MKRELREAAERGDTAALRALLAAGEEVDARDRHGQTALMLAARNGHAPAVRVLVAAGAELDHTAKYRLSALMLAAIGGHAAVARVLVEAGADTEITGTGAPGFAGRTAADLAEARGSGSLAALLRRRPGG